MARARRLRPAFVVAGIATVGAAALTAAVVRPAWLVRTRTYALTPMNPSGGSSWQPMAVPTPSFVPQPGSTFQPVGLPFSATWLVLISIGVVALLAVLTALLWWRACRRYAKPTVIETATESVPEPLAALRLGVAEAERRLFGEVDPSNAIITAWLALEEAAARSGVRRQAAETPTEFTLDVIARTGADPAPVRSLLRLYHRARFSVAGSPPPDLAAARRCVNELAAGWESFTLNGAAHSAPVDRAL